MSFQQICVAVDEMRERWEYTWQVLRLVDWIEHYCSRMVVSGFQKVKREQILSSEALKSKKEVKKKDGSFVIC